MATLVAQMGPHPVKIARTALFLADRRRRQGALQPAPPTDHSASLRPLPQIDIPPIADLPDVLRPSAERLCLEADQVIAHRMRFLGSEDVDLGAEIDWAKDFKSGYRWPDLWYRDLEITRLDDDSDAKVPWELSRGHQLLTLARAGRLTGERRYADELSRQIESWLRANPPYVGINWGNAMEAGIRAVNWIWVLKTLDPSSLEPALRARIAKSLRDHGLFIEANIEGTPYLRSNHYLADLLGLLGIGIALDAPEAARWTRVAVRGFEREIRREVHDDGVSFEASLPYHGLVLEMLLTAKMMADQAGVGFSAGFDRRLRLMLDVCRSVRHPTGRVPIFGDQDSGRVLPAGFGRQPSFDHLLDVGGAVLEVQLSPAAPHEEVLWTLGIDAWQSAQSHRDAPAPPRAFPDGGLYVLSSDSLHVVVRTGDENQHPGGGHSHNDLLSFELSCEVPIVVDSGTYSYTFDVEARNAFRSTIAHNVVSVDGEELQPLDRRRVFELKPFAKARVLNWSDDGSRVVLVAEHDGYCRLSPPVLHRRRFELDRGRGSLSIVDELEGGGEHEVAAFFHLAPGAAVDLAESGWEIRLAGRSIGFQLEGEGEVKVEEGWVSDSYGRRERAPVVVTRWRGALPTRFSHSFALTARDVDGSGSDRQETFV